MISRKKIEMASGPNVRFLQSISTRILVTSWLVPTSHLVLFHILESIPYGLALGGEREFRNPN
jgi:hypothetical protein